MRDRTCRVGRVEMWRGGCRPNISVAAPFVWRCLTGSTVAPFPHPAHRTGHADFPHPALGQDITPSPTTGHDQAVYMRWIVRSDRPTALGHRPAGPVGGLARRLGASQRQHLDHGGGCDRRFARRPGLVAVTASIREMFVYVTTVLGSSIS